MQSFSTTTPILDVKIDVQHEPMESIDVYGNRRSVRGNIKTIDVFLKNGTVNNLQEALLSEDETMNSLKATIKSFGINKITLDQTRFNSLEGIPNCGHVKLESNFWLVGLPGLHKYLTGTIQILEFGNQHLTSHALSLVLANVGHVSCTLGAFNVHDRQQFHNAIDIITDYVQKPHLMLECKEKLMNAGLKEFAKL